MSTRIGRAFRRVRDKADSFIVRNPQMFQALGTVLAPFTFGLSIPATAIRTGSASKRVASRMRERYAMQDAAYYAAYQTAQQEAVGTRQQMAVAAGIQPRRTGGQVLNAQGASTMGSIIGAIGSLGTAAIGAYTARQTRRSGQRGFAAGGGFPAPSVSARVGGGGFVAAPTMAQDPAQGGGGAMVLANGPEDHASRMQKGTMIIHAIAAGLGDNQVRQVARKYSGTKDDALYALANIRVIDTQWGPGDRNQVLGASDKILLANEVDSIFKRRRRRAVPKFITNFCKQAQAMKKLFRASQSAPVCKTKKRKAC